MGTRVREGYGLGVLTWLAEGLHHVAGDADLCDDTVARIRSVVKEYDTFSPVAN